MDNQHRQIKGYRELDAQDVALMNEVKELAELVGKCVARLGRYEQTDKDNVAAAKQNLQQGFMWAVRSIAKPETF